MVHTDEPNSDLNAFHGYVEPLNEDGENCPLKNKNLILRGCVLRNTDKIAGLVIYAGKNTKASLSNKGAKKKVSYLERLMNRDGNQKINGFFDELLF